MKTSVIFLSLFSFLLITNKTFSQGEAAVPFLLLQPSPSLAAMGQTGTALPTEDPFGFLWNPAQLGYTSQNNNFSFIFYPSKLDWLPELNADLEVKALAFNLGYNLKDFINFPLSVGFGYSNVEIDFGEFLRMDENGAVIGTFDSKDYYHAYSFGIGVDYLLQINVGLTYKSVTSILSEQMEEESGMGKAEPNVVDFGLLINVPVLKLIDEDMAIELEGDLLLKPDFNFSIGYTKSNIGDEVYYVDPSQADPLPRMDRIGYGISTGFDLLGDNFQMKILNFSLTVEADDILITSERVYSNDSLITYNWEYQSTLSDLKPWKNLINIEGTNKIVSHIGLKFDLFESFSFSTGHFSGRGFDERKTNGYELRTKGIFKLWALWAKDPITDFLRDHIDIRYYNTNFFADHYFETKMTGLAFYIHNLDSLF